MVCVCDTDSEREQGPCPRGPVSSLSRLRFQALLCLFYLLYMTKASLSSFDLLQLLSLPLSQLPSCYPPKWQHSRGKTKTTPVPQHLSDIVWDWHLSFLIGHLSQPVSNAFPAHKSVTGTWGTQCQMQNWTTVRRR